MWVPTSQGGVPRHRGQCPDLGCQVDTPPQKNRVLSLQVSCKCARKLQIDTFLARFSQQAATTLRQFVAHAPHWFPPRIAYCGATHASVGAPHVMCCTICGASHSRLHHLMAPSLWSHTAVGQNPLYETRGERPAFCSPRWP